MSTRARICAGMYTLALAAIGAPNSAAAQLIDRHRVTLGNGDGMDVRLFRPALDSQGYITANGAETLNSGDLDMSLVLDDAHNLMRLSDPSAHEGDALVTRSVGVTAAFTYGLSQLASVGLSATMVDMSGDALRSVGPSQSPYDAPAFDYLSLGTIAAHAKIRLASFARGPRVSLLLRLGGALSDDVARNLGGDKVFYWPELLIEHRLGRSERVRASLNVGFRDHTQENPSFDQLADGSRFSYANLFTASMAVGYRFLPQLTAIGETYLTEEVGTASSPATRWSEEAMLGMKADLGATSFLIIGAGGRVSRGFEAADRRAFAGFLFRPTVHDSDGDGIKDDVDLCPRQAEDFDGFQDADGCPDLDNDNDGILDTNDRCPNEPEDFNGVQDQDGCPDGSSDRDGDGIIDSCDKCPDDPEDRDGFQDADGCPDRGDRDKIAGAPREEEESAAIAGNAIVIQDQIRFATNSAEILPASVATLAGVATTMKSHPEILLVAIEGHADERSSDERNLELTDRRAMAVLETLVRDGVDRARLRAIGFGSYCPLSVDHGESAWAKNRRVEFKIVRTTAGPTFVSVGCPRASERDVIPAPEPR
jgi:outer membrane protein OmpA-like peptidoglycan-associated protein